MFETNTEKAGDARSEAFNRYAERQSQIPFSEQVNLQDFIEGWQAATAHLAAESTFEQWFDSNKHKLSHVPENLPKFELEKAFNAGRSAHLADERPGDLAIQLAYESGFEAGKAEKAIGGESRDETVKTAMLDAAHRAGEAIEDIVDFALNYHAQKSPKIGGDVLSAAERFVEELAATHDNLPPNKRPKGEKAFARFMTEKFAQFATRWNAEREAEIRRSILDEIGDWASDCLRGWTVQRDSLKPGVTSSLGGADGPAIMPATARVVSFQTMVDHIADLKKKLTSEGNENG